MADDEALEEIRKKKIEQLKAQANGENREEDVGSPDEPIHVEGDEHLQDILSTHDLVLVDFYADWCGPCKMLEPIVADLAAETPAAVAKVDADVHQSLTAQYGVQGLPTLVLFEGAEPVERIVGVRDKQTLAGLIDQYA